MRADGTDVALTTGSTALSRHPGRLTKTTKAPYTTDGRQWSLPARHVREVRGRTGLRPSLKPSACAPRLPFDCREGGL